MKKIVTVFAIVLGMSFGAFAHHSGHAFWGGFTGGLLGGLFAPRTTVVAAPAPVVTTPVVTTPVVVQQPVVTTPVVTQPVIATPPVVTTPVVTTPEIPAYSYAVYNGVSCPVYNGYYYYNNAWIWGGVGIRGPMPLWRPHPHHFGHPGFRPAPIHHAPIHRGPIHHGGPIRHR